MNTVNFTEYPLTTAVICLVNIPMYPHIAKLFFGERYESFWETIRLAFQGDLTAFFRGEYVDSFWADKKLILFIVFIVGWPLSVSEMFVRLFYL